MTGSCKSGVGEILRGRINGEGGSGAETSMRVSISEQGGLNRVMEVLEF